MSSLFIISWLAATLTAAACVRISYYQARNFGELGLVSASMAMGVLTGLCSALLWLISSYPPISTEWTVNACAGTLSASAVLFNTAGMRFLHPDKAVELRYSRILSIISFSFALVLVVLCAVWLSALLLGIRV